MKLFWSIVFLDKLQQKEIPQKKSKIVLINKNLLEWFLTTKLRILLFNFIVRNNSPESYKGFLDSKFLNLHFGSVC